MESHIGNLTGHAAAAKTTYRRYCVGCHGELGDGEGENAQWIDPKPRNFTWEYSSAARPLPGPCPWIPIFLTRSAEV